jgi:DNA polymerase-3 subunit delta
VTPEEFLNSIRQRDPAPAYLFVGPESYGRDRCRRALIERLLPTDEREQGLIRHDLDEVDLAAVIDDAQSFSLFAATRLIWAVSAEAAIPRGRAAASSDDDDDSGGGGGGGRDAGAGMLAAYLKNPAPGTVLVFDCARYEFDGDDKARVQKVQKFYSSIPAQVEFARYDAGAAKRLATQLAKERGLKIGGNEIEMLVEVLGADGGRVAAEIEKLSLYAGTSRAVTEDDIHNLTPNAKASTIFSLVAAMGRKDRIGSLESLDVLVREGEYLPLALSFLATQFRLALVAREAKVMSASQIQAYFSKQGTPMWRARAEQVAQTATAFPAARLKSALVRIYETDKALRDVRPDDRTVMERFVLELTA